MSLAHGSHSRFLIPKRRFRAVLILEEAVAVVRESAIQKAMDRFSGARNLPATRMTVAFFTLDSNELRLRTFCLELGSDPLTLRDVHVVIAGSMHREKRN